MSSMPPVFSRTLSSAVLIGIAALALAAPLSAREIFVAKNGADTNDGSAVRPVRTIQRGADLAQPGDTVTVRAGLYREWVKPLRGGTSDTQRITFRAAPGEEVKVAGSEPATGWTKAGFFWQVTLPRNFFGDLNPFAEPIKHPASGKENTDAGWGWLRYGRWAHRGDVFFNGEGFTEVEAEGGLARPKTWRAVVDAQGRTVITANFSDKDPNEGRVEVNVRAAIFYPDRNDVHFLTVRGFTFLNAATYWAAPLPNQIAAVGPNGGHNWIIEDNAILYSKGACLSIGSPSGPADQERGGHHVIRNNAMLRCGQAGIVGAGWNRASAITGNFIKDINYRYEFGGAETGGIKLHFAEHVTIDRNLIDGVGSIDKAHSNGDGIWLDVGAKDVSIRGNVLTGVDANTILMEANYDGPVHLENNVLVGGDISTFSSKNMLWSNNLFVGTPKLWVNQSDLNRLPIERNVWSSNIYVGVGDTGRRLPDEAGRNDRSTGNLYLGGAQPGPNEADAVVNAPNPAFRLNLEGKVATMDLTIDRHALAAQGQAASAADFFGKPRPRSGFAFGPFAGLKPGANRIELFIYPPAYDRAVAALRCGAECPADQ